MSEARSNSLARIRPANGDRSARQSFSNIEPLLESCGTGPPRASGNTLQENWRSALSGLHQYYGQIETGQGRSEMCSLSGLPTNCSENRCSFVAECAQRIDA